jgi:PIN domain nuclease of toxin-antitoxin system
MNLLLDTHALLWWLADDPTLSDSARTAIANPQHEVFCQ